MKKLAGLIFLLILLFTAASHLHPTYAQTCGTGIGKADGLVSAPDIGSFSTTGGCIKDPKTAFSPITIPTYADLKSLYFDRSKSSKDTTTFTPGGQLSATTSFTGDKVYLDSGDLIVTGTPTGTGTQVIFIDGNLTFNSNYTYNPAQGGTIFIVKGKVDISYQPLVTAINAVIISEGIICTAYDGSSCPGVNVTTQQLVINGSLISLNQTNPVPIQFKRSLDDNTQAAEKVVQQSKYLILLKDLVSQTSQKWSEVTGDSVLQTPPPAGSGSIPPAPTINSTSLNSSQISLSWGGSTQATSFKIYRCNDGPSCIPTDNPFVSTVSNTTYTDGNLSCNSLYRYIVQGINNSGTPSDSSNISQSTTSTCPLPAPTNLQAGVSNFTQINLTWSGTASSYSVYRCSTPACAPLTLIASPNISSFSQSPACGNTYRYVVRGGNGQSEDSNIDSATLICPPAAPTNVNSVVTNPTHVLVSWTPPSGTVTSYNILYCTGLNCTPDTAITGVTSPHNHTVTCGLKYSYKVQAVNAGGGSPYSSTVTASPTCPPTVTADAATFNNSGVSITLNSTINPNGAVTSGYFRYGTTNTFCNDSNWTQTTFTSVGSGSSPTPYSQSISTLSPTTTYYYCAFAVNGGGTVLDPIGSVKTFTTPIRMPAFDAASSSFVANSGTTALSWNHTVGTLPNRLLLVGVSVVEITSGKPMTVSSVTYGGIPLTRVTSVSNANNNNIELWSLSGANVQSGTRAIVVNTGSAAILSAGATSWSNVNPAAPLGAPVTAIGNSTTASVVVPSANNQIVVDVMGAGQLNQTTAITATAGVNQAEKWNATTSCASCNKITGAGSTKTGALPTTMSWTLSATRIWGAIGVAIKP